MAKGNFIEYVISDISNKYPNDGEKDGFYYERVITETEEKTVTAGTSPIEVTPNKGKSISKVTVNPTPTEEKTVTPTTEDLIVAPVEGKQLSKVTVQGDANFLEENIAEGVTMWGKTGTHQGGGSGPYKTLLCAGTDENGYTTYIPEQYPYEYIQNILSTKEVMLFFGIGVSIRPCIFVGYLQSQGPLAIEFTYLDIGLGEAGFGYVDDETGQITVDQPSSSFDSGLLDNAYIFYYDVL